MKKEELKEKILKGIQVTADKLKETAKISQLKARIFSLKRKINSDFTELGERYYNLIKEGRINSPDDEYLKNLIESIEGLEKEVNQIEEEIIKIKAQEAIEKGLEE